MITLHDAHWWLETMPDLLFFHISVCSPRHSTGRPWRKWLWGHSSILQGRDYHCPCLTFFDVWEIITSPGPRKTSLENETSHFFPCLSQISARNFEINSFIWIWFFVLLYWTRLKCDWSKLQMSVLCWQIEVQNSIKCDARSAACQDEIISAHFKFRNEKYQILIKIQESSNLLKIWLKKRIRLAVTEDQSKNS